jgi:hypothetical protein
MTNRKKYFDRINRINNNKKEIHEIVYSIL